MLLLLCQLSDISRQRTREEAEWGMARWFSRGITTAEDRGTAETKKWMREAGLVGELLS